MFLKTKFKNREKGFTLIELLVVIAIIGILSSVVLVSLGSARAKARDARRTSDILQLKNALEIYFSSYGRYPKSAEFAKLPDTPTEKYISPTFLPNMPTDPLTGAGYSYVALKIPTGPATSCLSYHLGATLEEATTGSPIMQTDSDASGGTPCTGGGAADFNGATPAVTCAAVAIPGADPLVEYCYDVTP